MRLKSLVTSIGISSAIILSSLSFSSCTPKVSEEQLAQLDELRRKERSLQSEIADKKSDYAKLAQELNARKAELKKCEEDKNFVKSKLASWPNVWPDYTPAAPKAEESK